MSRYKLKSSTNLTEMVIRMAGALHASATDSQYSMLNCKGAIGTPETVDAKTHSGALHFCSVDRYRKHEMLAIAGLIRSSGFAPNFV